MLYAGIGSRATPEPIMRKMFEKAAQLAESGWTLRSGGADGADSAFELGCDYAKGKKEIFLPWRDFNKNKSPLYVPTDKATEIASRFHQHWDSLKPSVKLLMSRNVHQVLGQDCETPVFYVICWTPNGEMKGGTSQALRIAQAFNIRIINLGKDSK